MIFKGKTIEEAINNGLNSLNITRDYAIITELEPIKILFTKIYRVDVSVNIEKIKYEKLEMQLRQEMEAKLKEEERKRKELEAREERKRKEFEAKEEERKRKELEAKEEKIKKKLEVKKEQTKTKKEETVIIEKETNFEEYVNSFLEFIEKTKKASKNTVESYERDLRQFKEYLEVKGYKFNELNANDIEIYLEYLKTIGKKDATRARGLASIRKLYEFLISKGVVEDNSIIKIKAVKVEKKEIDENIVEADAQKRQAILNYNFANTPKEYRDKAILEVSYKIKIKPTELISLTMDDFNANTKTLKIGNRTEQLDGEVVNALTNYLDKSRKYLDILQKENTLFLNVNGNQLTRQGYWKILKYYEDNINSQEPIKLFKIDEISDNNIMVTEVQQDNNTIIEEEKEELIEKVETVLDYEQSPLHIAIAKGDLKEVQKLITNGTDVNSKTTSLITPIMQAIFAIILIKEKSERNEKIKNELDIQDENLQDYESIVKLLIENGADLEIKIPERDVTIKEILEKIQ